MHGLQVIQSVSPVLSLSVIPGCAGDIVAASEDGFARVWSADPAKAAPPAVQVRHARTHYVGKYQSCMF